MNLAYSASAFQRLESFLAKSGNQSAIEILTPDASTREYFRIEWKGAPAIACVYPETFTAVEQAFLDLTRVFTAARLPVPRVYAFDEAAGVIVQEDFGDTILRDVLASVAPDKRDTLLNEAISLIARIQAATVKAFELNSVASRLKFDEEKLLWELNFFKLHFFDTYRKSRLAAEDDQILSEEFTALARELARHASVLCHRDYHAANLMIDRSGAMRIIDHQDARIGAASYDLVSLLLDRVLAAPDAEWLESKRNFLLNERERLGLKPIPAKDFAYEFDLMTVQRCLKAVGTFSYQSVVRDKTYFVQYIEPMLNIVLAACRRLQRFPNLQRIIKEIK